MRIQYLYWELSNYCNLHCKHCFAQATHDKTTIVRQDLLFKAIEKVAEVNVPAIRFGGGEPLLVPFLYNLLEYCRRKDIRVDMTTNGILLEEEIIHKLSRSGLRELTASVDGMEQTHDFMRGFGTYRSLQKNLDKAMEEARFQISLGYTVTAINYQEISESVETAYRKGIRKFYFFRYCGNNHRELFSLNSDQLHSASKTISQLATVYPDAQFNREGASFFHFGEASEVCNFLKGIITINYKGDVVVCAAIDKVLGNIYTDDYDVIYNRVDREREEMRKIPAACSACVCREICRGGCKSESYLIQRDYSERDSLCCFTDRKTAIR